MRKLFVDMDGVLADFDAHHEDVFGYRSCKVTDNVDWKAVRAIPKFYENIPPMPDVWQLWRFINQYEPTVLTGVPPSVEEAPENKRTWVRKHFGAHVPVICCASKEKSRYCSPGDVLIDDWEKYRHLWLERGGLWVTHTCAQDSIEQLRALGYA